MAIEHNSIFYDTNNYRSKIYPFLFVHKLVANKRFQLLFNKGNLLTNPTGTNALLPIIDIYLDRYQEKDSANKVVCCLGTHLFHSFVIMIESLKIEEQEVVESMKFILDKDNTENLESWKYLLAFFVIYLKLVNKQNEVQFLRIIKSLEEEEQCLSLLEYGQLQLKTVPLSADLLGKDGNNTEDVEILKLIDMVSAEKLWCI